MSPAELKMQPTIHFHDGFVYRTDIYEKVKIRGLKCIDFMSLIYGECNKNASAVAPLYTHVPQNSSTILGITKRMTFMSKFTKLY
jgi:exonuclease I